MGRWLTFSSPPGTIVCTCTWDAGDNTPSPAPWMSIHGTLADCPLSRCVGALRAWCRRLRCSRASSACAWPACGRSRPPRSACSSPSSSPPWPPSASCSRRPGSFPRRIWRSWTLRRMIRWSRVYSGRCGERWRVWVDGDTSLPGGSWCGLWSRARSLACPICRICALWNVCVMTFMCALGRGGSARKRPFHMHRRYGNAPRGSNVLRRGNEHHPPL
jgi:hypothetical protein